MDMDKIHLLPKGYKKLLLLPAGSHFITQSIICERVDPSVITKIRLKDHLHENFHGVRVDLILQAHGFLDTRFSYWRNAITFEDWLMRLMCNRRYHLIILTPENKLVTKLNKCYCKEKCNCHDFGVTLFAEYIAGLIINAINNY